MRIRRIVLDVDKGIQRPDIVDVAVQVEKVTGVEAVNITVTEIDIETVGMDVTVEGDGIDWPGLVKAIEGTGAMVHSVDQLVSGTRIIEGIKRSR
ncbi:DUF211 domain-containing protein [Sphaerimonospora cavernae]|uniref:DUF211 domain-containing protein n=1 Tax=Sphaerimonospora cavernae TaxID=1740611 RepID=A0ABV6TXF8_9ACTN